MILVTGGAGFIGSHLVEQLAQRGERVRVLDLPSAAAAHLESFGVEIIRDDVRNLAAVAFAVRGCRRVYHLAGNPNLWVRRRADFFAVNHRGSVNVLRESLRAGVERILFCSTESILATREPNNDSIETRRLAAAEMVGPYCESKYLAEREAFRLSACGAPVVVVAPTLPVGPGDRNRTPPTRMTVDFCRGKLPAYLDCKLNMIDVRDVAAGAIAAMDRGRLGVRYLLGNRNLRLIEWFEMVGREIGRPPPRWRVPYWLALAAAWCSEVRADYWTGENPNATVTGVRLARRLMHFDPANSLAELGIQPRPLEQSIRDAVAWYRENKWI